jgi:hypothetical protein
MSGIVSKPATEAYRENWERMFGEEARQRRREEWEKFKEDVLTEYTAPPRKDIVWKDNALLRILRGKRR